MDYSNHFYGKVIEENMRLKPGTSLDVMRKEELIRREGEKLVKYTTSHSRKRLTMPNPDGICTRCRISRVWPLADNRRLMRPSSNRIPPYRGVLRV